MRVRTTISALAAGALLTLTACSAEPGTAGRPVSTTPAQDDTAVRAAAEQTAAKDAVALEAAVRAHWAAYFTIDPAAYLASLSESCRSRGNSGVPRTEVSIKAELEQAAQDRPKHKDHTLRRFSVDELNGDTANVTYGLQEDPTFDEHGELWIREDAAWRFDAC